MAEQFFGKYRAEVYDIKDPEQRGRIRVTCPKVLGKNISTWALPCFLPNQYGIPKKGSLVWVEFEGGDRDSPVWTGVFYTSQTFRDKFGTVYDDGFTERQIISSSGIDLISGDTPAGHADILIKAPSTIELNGGVVKYDNDLQGGNLPYYTRQEADSKFMPK